MKKGNRKILLGLLAVFLLLVGLYVYHMNTLREGGGFGVGNAHERERAFADDLRIDGEIYTKMMDVRPGWRLDGVVNGVEAEWKVYSNFDFQKTKANWEKTGGALLDSNGLPVKYKDPTTGMWLNDPPEETHLSFMDKEMIAAQTEYQKTNVLTNEGFIRVSELKKLYPDIPPKGLFDILKVEEMRGSTMSAENLNGLNELAKVQPELVEEILRIEINEPETNEPGADAAQIMESLEEKQSGWSLEDWEKQTNFDMEKTLELWNPETKIVFDSNGMPAKYNDITMGNRIGGVDNLINTTEEMLQRMRIDIGIPQAEVERLQRMWTGYGGRMSGETNPGITGEPRPAWEEQFPAHETNPGITGEPRPAWETNPGITGEPRPAWDIPDMIIG